MTDAESNNCPKKKKKVLKVRPVTMTEKEKKRI